MAEEQFTLFDQNLFAEVQNDIVSLVLFTGRRANY